MNNSAEISGLFTDILENPDNRFISQARKEGMIPVGYTCSYVPKVLLNTDRLFPVRMRAPGIAGTEIADTYLSSVTCSYSRSILEQAIDDRYDFLEGWVFAASCDHLRRLYDNLEHLAKPDFNYMLDVPHKISDRSLQWFTDEVKNLAGALSDHFGVDTGAESIRKAVDDCNECSSLLREIGDLRKNDNPPLTGTEYHGMIMSAQSAPFSLLKDEIQQFRKNIEKREPLPACRARLLVTGCNCDDPSYLDVIESQGGLIVADRFCTGSLPGLDPVTVEGDIYESVARHYLEQVSCPRMMEEFDTRVDNLFRIIDEYRVDGVIIQSIKFCDIWGVETGSLVNALRKRGVPVLRLEREYRLSGEGQLKTRVQAFMESMGR